MYVGEIEDALELETLVSDYLRELQLPTKQIEKIVQFYIKVKTNINLVDGIGKRPHFSLRTLCRALKIASAKCFGSVGRSLYEAFCLSFLTQLDNASYLVVLDLINR